MGHILIADDIAISRDTLSRVLREAGHRVTQVASGEEAIERARSERPDMAILDLNMPRLTGLQAAPLIKAEFPAQFFPVIIMSGRTLSATELTELLAEVEDFWRKPFATSELCPRIEVWLRIRRLIDSAQRGAVPAVEGPRQPSQPPGSSAATSISQPPFPVGERKEPSPRVRTRAALIERIDEEWRRSVRWNAPFALLLCEGVPLAAGDSGKADAGSRQRGEAPSLASAQHGAAASVASGHSAALSMETTMQKLHRVATRTMRQIDILGMAGMSRLAVLLPNTPPAGSLHAAERLRSEFKTENDGALGLCLGLALVPGRDIVGPEELFRAAETALLRACEEGPWSLCLHQHQGYLVLDG